MKKIVVIGSGFGGLASAIRLQTRGFQVDLFEARDKLGGRAYLYEQDGFKFDGGPTVITAPFMLAELFSAAGKEIQTITSNSFPSIRFIASNFTMAAGLNTAAMKRKLKNSSPTFAPDDVAGYRRLVAHAKAVFQKGFVELSDKPFLKFSDMLRVAPDLIRLQSYKTVYQFAAGYIKDPLLRRVFSFHPLLVGGNPFQTTSIYALIHYLEREWGVHYAIGGTGAIIAALGKLFSELGGRAHLSTPIAKLLLENRIGQRRCHAKR